MRFLAPPTGHRGGEIFAISFHWKSLLVWRYAGTVRGKHRSEALYKVRLYPTFVVLLRLFV